MKKKLIIIIVIVLILGGAGGFVGWKFLLVDDTIPSDNTEEIGEEKKEEGGDASALVVYPLETFVVNLSGSGGRRYLKIKITLEIDGSKTEEMKKEDYKIRDAMIILLSSKTLENIMSAEGKYSLREEIKVRLDRILGKAVIKDVYIVEFVIQ